MLSAVLTLFLLKNKACAPVIYSVSRSSVGFKPSYSTFLNAIAPTANPKLIAPVSEKNTNKLPVMSMSAKIIM